MFSSRVIYSIRSTPNQQRQGGSISAPPIAPASAHLLGAGRLDRPLRGPAPLSARADSSARCPGRAAAVPTQPQSRPQRAAGRSAARSARWWGQSRYRRRSEGCRFMHSTPIVLLIKRLQARLTEQHRYVGIWLLVDVVGSGPYNRSPIALPATIRIAKDHGQTIHQICYFGMAQVFPDGNGMCQDEWPAHQYDVGWMELWTRNPQAPIVAVIIRPCSAHSRNDLPSQGVRQALL
jgi:hypothetical protein